MTLPSVSVTVAPCTTAAMVSPRRTSANMAGSWLFCCSTCSSCCGSMPYWRDISTRRSVRSPWPTWMSSLSATASISSWVLTAFSALLWLSASNSSRLLPCSVSCSLNLSSSCSKPWMALCRVSSTCALTIASGSGTSTPSRSTSSALSRICSACWMRLTRLTCSTRLSFSSAMVSNSLASCANSSSASGSSRSLTDFTVTVTSASLPACSPAARVVVKVLLSSTLRPMIASSRPSMS